MIQSGFTVRLSPAIHHDAENDNRAEIETPSGEISLRAITLADGYTFSPEVKLSSCAQHMHRVCIVVWETPSISMYVLLQITLVARADTYRPFNDTRFARVAYLTRDTATIASSNKS